MHRLLPTLLFLSACGGEVLQLDEIAAFDGPVERVVLDVGSADVLIVATELAGAVLHQSGRYNQDPPDVQTALEAGTLTIVARCPGGVGIHRACNLDLVLEIPADAELEAELGSGDLTLDGLGGGFDVRGGGGDIVGWALTSAVGLVQGGSGDVDLELDAVPDEVDIHTGAGDVRLVVPDAAYAITTDSGSGDVTVDGIDQVASETRTLSLETGSGDIVVQGR